LNERACVAVHCSVLQCTGAGSATRYTWCVDVCVAVRCSVLQCIARCCSVLQCIARCFSALQYIGAGSA